MKQVKKTEKNTSLNTTVYNYPYNPTYEEEILGADEKLDLRTGSMVCCSCSQRYEDCPNQADSFAINPRVGSTPQTNQSINSQTNRDIQIDKITTNGEEEPVRWENDSPLNTHCPPHHPFPCFCYSTKLEESDQDPHLKSPALDVHLSFDTKTNEFDVHKVHITNPSS